MSNVIPFHYQGRPVLFSTDGWINATDIAKRYGKRPVDWLKQEETQSYLEALADFLGQSKVTSNHFGLVRTVKGGRSPGTWLHPKLAVRFAQWLDVRFAVWCDMQIDALMRGGKTILQHLEEAQAKLDDNREQASTHGRGLAEWKNEKPRLEHQVDYWREQLQIPLFLDAA